MAKNGKEKRKNYMILGIIYVAVILLVLYLASWYKTYQDYQLETPVLQNTISQITTEEMEHYLLENPNSILYFCVAKDQECRNFEKEFKMEILRNEWQDQITYVDLDQKEDKISYLNQLIMNYQGNQTVSKTPVFLLFSNGQITNVIAGSDISKLTVSRASRQIEEYMEEE